MNYELSDPAPPSEVMAPASNLEAITRGEIDIQIATAQRYPRSLTKFKKMAVAMVQMDEETAASCLYRRPVGVNKDTGEQTFAEGMSIRMAEIVAACYGNIRHGSFIVSQTERSVVARGFCHDVEGNVAATCEVVESTVTSKGQPYSERMRIVVAKAALAKADRDAVFKVVPRALCRPIEVEARRVAVGDALTLEKQRENIKGWIQRLGIAPERVFTAIGVKGMDDIGLDHIATLVGIKTAIKENELTPDEAFPALESSGVFGSTTPTTPPAKKRAKTPQSTTPHPEAQVPPDTANPPQNEPEQQTGAAETTTPTTAKPDFFQEEKSKPKGEPVMLIQLRAKMHESSISESEVLAVCRLVRIPNASTLATCPPATWDTLVGDFGEVIEAVNAAREKQTATP